MRILYHHRILGDGAEGIHVSSMVEAFRRLGHEVRVRSLIEAGEAHGDPRTAARRRIGELLKRAPRALYELAEIAYNARAYLDARRAIRVLRPHFVYDRYNLFTFGVVLAARRAGLPVFLEVNTPYAHQRKVYEKLALERLAGWLEPWTWKRATHVLVVSTPLRRYVVGSSVPEDRVTVLPNGADLERFRPRERPAGGASGCVFGFVGSLRAWHGVDLLLEAAAPLLRADPGLRLRIVGHGPARPALEEQAARLGVAARVDFAGAVSHARVPEAIAGFDVGVSPRTTFYQSPMKLVEYMAMAKPVVAPDSENVRDLVEPGSEGLLFPPDDPEGLRSALARLAADEQLRLRLGARARARVERRHTWESNALAVLALYEKWARAAGRALDL